MNYPFENCRYGDVLADLLNKLGCVKLLYCHHVDDYQGDVDVDALLSDGRIYSYYYSYGSCSGCDEWEDRGLNETAIERIMRDEATFFSGPYEYKAWLEKLSALNDRTVQLTGIISQLDLTMGLDQMFEDIDKDLT